MVYNWNKMVTITVPVGLNGWQTRGRVIINGREYTFPIGVETQVPEPVAAHINKLIKMEEEDKPELPESGCVDTVAREQITALTEEMAALKNPESEVVVSKSGDIVVINPGEGKKVSISGNTDATEVTLVHCGENIIDISGAKNFAGESVYDDGWIVFSRSEADSQESAYAQCVVPLVPAIKPGKKYNLYIEISDDTNTVGVWTLATGQKNVSEALNTQVGGLSNSNRAGVYFAPVETKEAFASGVVYAMRHIFYWSVGAYGTVKYRPWYTAANSEMAVPDAESPFVSSDAKYAEYSGTVYTKTLPAGHSGAYDFDSLTAFAGNNTIVVSDGVVTASYTEVVTDDRVGNPLYGKRIAVLGDSISTTSYTRPNYWEMISEKTGCTFENYALSSSRIANVEGDAVESFIDRFDRMDASVDAVLVMGGTNDAGKQTLLGQWGSDDASTFYGAINELIGLLRGKYVGKPIVFCTPIRRNSANDHDSTFPKTFETLKEAIGTDAVSLDQVALAIKAKCASNAIPVVDLFYGSGIGWNCAEYFNEGDVLHPNTLGHVRIANMVQAELEKQFLHTAD